MIRPKHPDVPRLRYRPTHDAPWTEIHFPASVDLGALLEFVRARMFPGVEVVPWVPERVELVKLERKRRRKA